MDNDEGSRFVIEQSPGLPDHTMYRSRDLAALGDTKLPSVAWGNGACVDNDTAFRWFLSEIASYGFLVIANGRMGRDPIEFRMRGDSVPPVAAAP